MSVGKNIVTSIGEVVKSVIPFGGVDPALAATAPEQKFVSPQQVAEHFRCPASLIHGWIEDGVIQSKELKDGGESCGSWIPDSEVKVVAGLLVYLGTGTSIDRDLAEKIRNSTDQTSARILSEGPISKTLDEAVASFRRRAQMERETAQIKQGQIAEAESHRIRARAIFIRDLKKFASDLSVVIDNPEVKDALAEIKRLIGLKK